MRVWKLWCLQKKMTLKIVASRKQTMTGEKATKIEMEPEVKYDK